MIHYLNGLEGSGVDLNHVYVYQRPGKLERQVYGVLYGTFQNRDQAQQALKTLPQVLAVNRPIPRTFRGLRAELGRIKERL